MCGVCGRPRGFIRDMGMCRICVRHYADKILGLQKDQKGKGLRAGRKLFDGTLEDSETKDVNRVFVKKNNVDSLSKEGDNKTSFQDRDRSSSSSFKSGDKNTSASFHKAGGINTSSSFKAGDRNNSPSFKNEGVSAEAYKNKKV